MTTCQPRREASEETNPLAPWYLRLSSLQNQEKINFWCLSYRVCGILLWQLEQTNTPMKWSSSLLRPRSLCSSQCIPCIFILSRLCTFLPQSGMPHFSVAEANNSHQIFHVLFKLELGHKQKWRVWLPGWKHWKAGANSPHFRLSLYSDAEGMWWNEGPQMVAVWVVESWHWESALDIANLN